MIWWVVLAIDGSGGKATSALTSVVGGMCLGLLVKAPDSFFNPLFFIFLINFFS